MNLLLLDFFFFFLLPPSNGIPPYRMSEKAGTTGNMSKYQNYIDLFLYISLVLQTPCVFGAGCVNTYARHYTITLCCISMWQSFKDVRVIFQILENILKRPEGHKESIH